MGKVTYNDLKEATQADLRRVYKLNDRTLEHAVRSHLDGANAVERRQTYETVYSNKNKR